MSEFGPTLKNCDTQNFEILTNFVILPIMKVWTINLKTIKLSSKTDKIKEDKTENFEVMQIFNAIFSRSQLIMLGNEFA